MIFGCVAKIYIKPENNVTGIYSNLADQLLHMRVKEKIRRIFSRAVVATIIVFTLLPLALPAQFYHGSQQNFGRSRVSFSDFLWTYYRFEDFDTYFYLNGEHIAAYTAWMAKQEIPKIAGMMETSLQEKLQFVIFNRLTDVRQSNIGLHEETQYTYNTGGITHIVGKRIFLYFDGNYMNFDRQIRAGIARVLIEQALYGGSIGSQITASASQRIPEWYLSGLVSYIAEPWSVETDNILRNAFLTDRYRRFNRLEGQEAMYAGHSIWKYIADKYGEAVLSNLVYMTRLGRSIDNSLVYILGISFKTLLKEWEAHYKAMYEPYRQTLPPAAQTLKVKNRKGEVYQNLRLNPNGNHAAYVSNHLGRYRVILHNLLTDKKRVVLRGGYRLEEVIDYSYPLLAWHPGGELLAIISEDKGLVNLNFYNLNENKKTLQYLFNFEKILDFSYSNDGFHFIFSGVQKGKTNVYRYHIPSNSFEQITDGIYDDHSPAFIDNSNRIIFSSNRPPDSLNLKTQLDFQPTAANYSLFLYDLNKREKTLRRVIYDPLSNQVKPREYANGHFSYLSDESGILNRYAGRFDSTIAYVDTITHYRYFVEAMAVTDYPGNIVSYDVNQKANRLGEIIYHQGKYSLRIEPLKKPANLVSARPEPTAYMSRKLQRTTLEGTDGKTIAPEAQKRKRFRNVMRDEILTELKEADEPEIDYELFGDSVPPGIPRRIEAHTEQEDEKFIIPKRLNYNVEYFIDQMVNQVDFTYLAATYQPFTGGRSPLFLSPGLNAFFSVSLVDLLEDYRIIGGVRLNSNFVNNEYVLSFSNYKRRLNKEYVFYRQSLDEFRESPVIRNRIFIVRHRIHEFRYILTWPFTRVLSLKGSLIYKHDKAVHLATDQLSLLQDDKTRNWGGLKAELIYDDSKPLGINLFQGTRAKLFGEYYQGITEDPNNMVVLGLDVRHYLPIHRNFIWANRFATSTSFGNNLLIYYLGGVDNWLLPQFDQDMAIDYTKAYAYQTLATNMRGFKQNIRNGNSFFVLSSELRLPVFRYLLNRPIRSQFINDFQLVGFADVGSAWTGLHPLSPDNHLFRKYFEQGPISGWIEMQKEPIVAGLGVGARTTILGYFVRADIAWGFEDDKLRKPMFYLSFGTDF